MAKKKGAIDISTSGCVVAIRCFIDGQRVQTDLLNKDQARVLRYTAQHLIKYLTATYGLDKPARKLTSDGRLPGCRDTLEGPPGGWID